MSDPKTLALSYMAFNFWVDLLSVLPLDYLPLGVDLRFCGLFRLFRVKRIYQVRGPRAGRSRGSRRGAGRPTHLDLYRRGALLSSVCPELTGENLREESSPRGAFLLPGVRGWSGM